MFMEQKIARMFEVNLESSLMASRLAGEPIRCARLVPVENCDLRAEHLSLNLYNCSVFNFAISPEIGISLHCLKKKIL